MATIAAPSSLGPASRLSYWGVALILALLALPSALAMECYVCNNQEGNRDKCVKTSRQCQAHENACYSLIKYQLPTQYWQQNGIRTHFIDKNCTTLDQCRSDSDDMAIRCNREWYNDWTCLECCSGELCNYYATMSADRFGSVSAALWLAAALVPVSLRLML